jgi:hypothetical protein
MFLPTREGTVVCLPWFVSQSSELKNTNNKPATMQMIKKTLKINDRLST